MIIVFIKTSMISCVFLNPFDTSAKTCCVRYELYEQKGAKNISQCNNNMPYMIQLEVSSNSSQIYHYTVTANNDTYTVTVEGKFTRGITIINTHA